MSGGCTGKRVCVHVVHQGGFHSWNRGARPSTGRKQRTLSVRGWLQRRGTSSVAEVVHVAHPRKIPRRVQKGYMLYQEEALMEPVEEVVTGGENEEEEHVDPSPGGAAPLGSAHAERAGSTGCG